MSSRCLYIWRFFIVTLGLFFIASGVYLYLNWIDIFTRLRGQEMALSPTSQSYAGWKVSPLPLNFDVYLFNWTNPEDFYEGSTVKPHFVELGPYRFREKPDKVDIVWHANNHSVSFRKKASFHFDAAGSKGKLDDRITTVNTVAHAAALRSRNANYFQKKIFQRGLSMYNEGLTVTKTADELLFTGYSDPFVSLGTFFSMFNKDIVVPFDRVGYFYKRNNSDNFDGLLNMYTGADDIYKLGQVHTWNHKTHNGIYPGECGEVKGSLGEFYPPNLMPNDSISIYLPNMCRSVPLDYTEMVDVHGVQAFKFSGGPRSVDNGTLYPEAKCFCVNNKCEPSGVINISPCKFNTSMYMSYPHFYQADPSYLEAVDGLKPEREKHEFFMTLEPNSGVVMDVGGGFQANYLLESVDDIIPFDSIPRTFIPLMWCEERVRVTPEIAKDIALVPLIVLIGQLITAVLLASGLILICWYPTRFFTKLCHDPKTKNVLLNPLSSAGVNTKINTVTQPQPQQQEKHPVEGLPLLEYRNGSFLHPDDTVSNELLSNTLQLQSVVITTR